MIKILFIRSKKAYLPEIDAYIEYFNNTSEFKAFDSSKIKSGYDLMDFNVIWEFKGLGGIKSDNQFVVHEYASLSTGLFPRQKDMIKSITNPKPNLRIFLNETVKQEFRFNDNIEFCFRDMGIDKSFLNKISNEKEYDFVYIGSMEKGRNIDKLLHNFTRKKNGKLCLIGKPTGEIYKKYKSNKDIIFAGKVPYKDVPEIASKAVYGINYIPDKYPYNVQTSTKVLEYLALGLNVVTTDYKWAIDFEKNHDCSFYKLDDNEFDINEINRFKFQSNFKPEHYLWNVIIEKSKISQKILTGINSYK